MKKPIIFYGAGNNGKKYLSFLNEWGNPPLCFIDKGYKKIKEINGIPVVSLEEAIDKYPNCCIYITPSSPLSDQIREELLESGLVLQENIINSVNDQNTKYKTLCDLFLLTSSNFDSVVKNETPTSAELANRLSLMFQKYYFDSKGDGQWEELNNLKKEVCEVLLSGNEKEIAQMLSNPQKTNLFFGFDTIYDQEKAEHRVSFPITEMALLYRIGEIWGGAPIVSVVNGEFMGISELPLLFANAGKIIQKLNQLFLCDIQFPNPYIGEIGLEVTTSSGVQIASYRALQAVHQAFLIWDKLGRKSGRVIEIGAGLGRTAYYCKELFDIDYTIVDLAVTQVASAHFLMQVWGEGICLYGEPYSEGQVKFLPPYAFLKEYKDKVDLIVNIDSLTEMDISTMKSYWNKIKESTKAFLSVNHEMNEHSVRELIYGDSSVKTYSRHLYELRVGYAQEYVTFH